MKNEDKYTCSCGRNNPHGCILRENCRWDNPQKELQLDDQEKQEIKENAQALFDLMFSSKVRQYQSKKDYYKKKFKK